MLRERKSAQLRQQLSARNPLRGASKSTPIVTLFEQIAKGLAECAAVFAVLAAGWLAVAAVEQIYQVAPVPTVAALFIGLVVITGREIIYQWRDD